MRVLIDTHVLIWSVIEPERLSSTVFELLSDTDNEVLVSPVSGYEIELKRRFDSALMRMPDDLDLAVSAQGFRWTTIDASHTTTAGKLPKHHRDPWGRILVAQGLVMKLPVVTRDPIFKAYGVPVIW